MKILKRIADADTNVVNASNFGHFRSSWHAFAGRRQSFESAAAAGDILRVRLRRALYSGVLLLSGLQAAILEPVPIGMAPLAIGIFFFSSIQLISVGFLGEYIGSIHTHAQKRPVVVQGERVNFEYEPGDAVPSGETVTAK